MSDCEQPRLEYQDAVTCHTVSSSSTATKFRDEHATQDNSDADSPTEAEQTKGKSRMQSHDDTALAIWQWTQDTFEKEASNMYEQLCERLHISKHVTKKIRRRSMPATTTAHSAPKLPGDTDNDSVIEAPPARIHARLDGDAEPVIRSTFAQLPDAVLNDDPFTDRATISSTPYTSTMNGLNNMQQDDPMTGSGMGQPTYMMTTLMQYGEPPSIPPRHPMRGLPRQQRYSSNFRSPAHPPMLEGLQPANVTPSSSSQSMRRMHSGMPLCHEDTQILLSAVDRGLIPAEKLEPDQCQQVLAAQQQARYYTSTSRPEHLRRPVDIYAHHNAYDRSSLQAQQIPYRPRHAAQAYHPAQPPIFYPVRPTARPYNSTHPHLKRHSFPAGMPTTHESNALIPQPLQCRPPLEPKGSSYDAARSEARRVQWVEDTQRAQRVEEVKKHDEVVRHAGLIEEHRASKRAHEQREVQKQARREAADQLMRCGSMQQLFRKGIQGLQAKARFA